MQSLVMVDLSTSITNAFLVGYASSMNLHIAGIILSCEHGETVKYINRYSIEFHLL